MLLKRPDFQILLFTSPFLVDFSGALNLPCSASADRVTLAVYQVCLVDENVKPLSHSLFNAGLVRLCYALSSL